MKIQITFIPFFIEAIYPVMLSFSLGGLVKGVGNFLFGSTDDPGKKSRKALEGFGFGEGDLFEGLSEQANLRSQFLGAQERQSAAARSARSGFTGTGLGEDIQQDANLNQASFLRKTRFDLIQQRLRALGGLASIPKTRTQGLVQGATNAFAEGFGSSLGGG